MPHQFDCPGRHANGNGPGKAHFASAGEDRVVMIWNSETGRREMLLPGHPTRV